MTMSKDATIQARVERVLVDALGIEPEDATLAGDLGAESIDFLDLQFRLGKEFGIEVEDRLVDDPEKAERITVEEVVAWVEMIQRAER